jgi:arylsulfatase A-like enzyme
VGDFFERLEQMGLFAGSTVALTADHGEEFLDHGGWWHGTTLYQEQIHVPLLIKRPNEAQPGLLRRDPVRSVDIAPTLMATGGAVAPRAFQGRDLFGPIPPEAAVRFAEEDLEGNQLNALRVGDWKIVSANPGNPRGLPPLELFDLSRDPRETDNLAGVEAARVQAMLRQMGEVRAATSRLIE